jgi:hypothetical protein
MRVLFLDIDGVLNSRLLVESVAWEPPLGTERDLDIIDAYAISLLDHVVHETGAQVVVTSSWRATYGLEALRSLLARRGFSGTVLDMTPQLVGRLRSSEIERWLADHEVESFAIVDDDEEAGSRWRSRFVHTTYETGLTREHALRLIALLSDGDEAH